MRYWDTSAIVPLLADEAASEGVAREYERDPDMVVWWSTVIECASAIARREREGGLRPREVSEAFGRLEALELAWREVQPIDRLRSQAVRLLRVHPLRAGDALQLAAALIAAEDHPRTLPLLTLDDQVALAAEREGFPVLKP